MKAALEVRRDRTYLQAFTYCRASYGFEKLVQGVTVSTAHRGIMSRRILIADDSAIIRRTIRSWIQLKTDWAVCGEAGDGKATIDLVQRLNPDIVILDVAMPIMT